MLINSVDKMNYGYGPSAMREVFVEVPDVKWEDIGWSRKCVNQESEEALVDPFGILVRETPIRIFLHSRKK